MPDFGFDEWMEARLRDVPLPPDWHARLAANRPPSDNELDALVRDVDIPPHLERHLRRIARTVGASFAWQKLALAASVLIVITVGGYWTLVRGTTASRNPAVARQTRPPMARSNQVAAQPDRAPRETTVSPRRQQPVTVPLGTPPQVANEAPRQGPFTMEDVATVGTTFKQAIEARLRTEQALGAGGKIHRLPELAALETPLPRGVSPPRLLGYDMLFQLRHGEHPFVSPAAHRKLRVSRVPFTFRTTSYDLAMASVEAGQLPAKDEIRVEDFLAAQRYALPTPPAAGLSLHAAASHSPLGEPGLHLLQLIVQGGKASNPRRKPAQLVLVVDTSSAMQYDARCKTVQRALANLGRQLNPNDRITLIGFAEQPRVLAEDANRAELETLLSSATLEQTSGSADLSSAIQSACAAVRAVPSNQARRVVFITAGRAEFSDAGRTRSRESLLQLTAANIPWQIVHTSPAEDDSEVRDLARTARGRTRAVTSGDELYAVLLEELTGRPQTVAHGVSMRITFNPSVVTSYRMLGHESATLTGETSDPLQVDLHAEQAATALYEMWLKPTGDDVAIVELLWRDPNNGQPRRRVQPIRRNQIATSFATAPPWLQQGVLAASTAEFLRGSYYVPRSRRLDQLLDLSTHVDPRAAKMPEFRALVHLIDKAGKLR